MSKDTTEGSDGTPRPLNSITKWTTGLIGPVFALHVTTMVILAVAVAPAESVADIQT